MSKIFWWTCNDVQPNSLLLSANGARTHEFSDIERIRGAYGEDGSCCRVAVGGEEAKLAVLAPVMLYRLL